MKIVRVTMEGGVIQDIDCPKGVKVIVKDYDTDGSEESVKQDDNGDNYIETIGSSHADIRDRTVRVARHEVPGRGRQRGRGHRQTVRGRGRCRSSKSQDMIEVADDYGLPADEHPELAKALRKLGIPVDAVIPSIRSIEEV